MSSQDTKPTRVEEKVTSDSSATSQKSPLHLAQVIFLVVIIVIVGIILLALLGPAVGNVYSYTGGSL